MSAQRSPPVLSVENLQTAFFTDKEEIHAVQDISFEIQEGETVGIVGESGSGKSVTARSIMGLVESPGRVLDGSSIKFRGEELTKKSPKEYRRIRGSNIAMIFQDPLSSLNPVYTVGNQIKEAIRLHQGLRGQDATEAAVDVLEAVSIPDPRRRLKEYPHQFSGGMQQRAVIAMALACDPDLLICDEPTTALDVTIQAQILDLLDELQKERDLSIMFITHDMGVIANVTDRVNVMYAGEIVEKAPVEELFENPHHPYTKGLLESIPGRNVGENRLSTIEGDVPTPNELASYCQFAPRCPEAFDACERVHPANVAVGPDHTDHTAACLLHPDDMSEEDRVTHHRAKRDQFEEDRDTATSELKVNNNE